MKKVFYIIGIILLELIIPPYKELNNILIVDKIEITCTNTVTIKIKEIVPVKKENTIEYQYKYYEKEGRNIKDILKEIEKEEKKTIYLNHNKIKCK